MTSFYGMVYLEEGGGDGGVTREQVQQMINSSIVDMKDEISDDIKETLKDDIKKEVLDYHLDDDTSTPEDDDGILVFPTYPSMGF